MPLGPFDLTGGPFLILYLSLLVVTIIAGIAFRIGCGQRGRPGVVTQAEELAYLSGGRIRFSEAVTARLLAARGLILERRKRFAIGLREAAGTAAERSLLALSPPIRWKAIERNLRPHAEQTRQRLSARGLVMTDEELSNIRFWSTLPYLLLLAFGAIKWMVGDMRDRPVG